MGSCCQGESLRGDRMRSLLRVRNSGVSWAWRQRQQLGERKQEEEAPAAGSFRKRGLRARQVHSQHSPAGAGGGNNSSGLHSQSMQGELRVDPRTAPPETSAAGGVGSAEVMVMTQWDQATLWAHQHSSEGQLRMRERIRAWLQAVEAPSSAC